MKNEKNKPQKLRNKELKKPVTVAKKGFVLYGEGNGNCVTGCK